MTFLVLSAFSELIVYAIVTRFGGFPRVRKLVKVTKRSRRIPHEHTVENVVEAIDIACCFYVHKVMCLHRSFAAVRLLRRMGVDADLIIATRPAPFLSHAWVEVNNEIVNDNKGYKRKLLVMDRI